MDDDVKNLFQKFGQPATAYQEINRDVESEQAKKRWPLLRDVRVHAIPDNSMPEDMEPLPVPQASPSIRPEIMPGIDRKPVLKESIGSSSHGASDIFGRKQELTPTESVVAVPEKINGSASLFRSERQQKATLFQTDEQLQQNSSLFRRLPADAVSAQGNGAGSQEKVAVLPVHADKHQAVSDIFKRLAKQPEPAKTVDTPVNSFFKKIFKS